MGYIIALVYSVTFTYNPGLTDGVTLLGISIVGM